MAPIHNQTRIIFRAQKFQARYAIVGVERVDIGVAFVQADGEGPFEGVQVAEEGVYEGGGGGAAEEEGAFGVFGGEGEGKGVGAGGAGGSGFAVVGEGGLIGFWRGGGEEGRTFGVAL